MTKTGWKRMPRALRKRALFTATVSDLKAAREAARRALCGHH